MLESVQGHDEVPSPERTLEEQNREFQERAGFGKIPFEERDGTSEEEARQLEQRVREMQQVQDFLAGETLSPEEIERMYEESQKPPIKEPSLETMESAKAKLNRRVPSTSFIEKQLPVSFRVGRFAREHEVPRRAYRYGIDIPATAIDKAFRGAKRQYRILSKLAGTPINQRSRIRKRIIRRTISQ